MKKVTLLALLAFSTAGVSLNAQELSVGFRGGLNIPNLTAGGNNNPLSEGYKSRLAGAGGIFAEYKFSKLFSLRAGVEYSGQGGRKDGMQAMPSQQLFTQMAQAQPNYSQIISAVGAAMPQYLYSDVESTVKFNYLMVPILAKFSWNLSATSPFNVYVSAGPFVSFMLSGHRDQSGTSGIYANPAGQSLTDYFVALPANAKPPMPGIDMIAAAMLTPAGAPRDQTNEQNITDDLRPVNTGFAAYAGIGYSFATHHNIFVEGGGNYGLIKVQKDDKNGANRIGAGSIMLGYTYTFGK